jgi:hypothetical protein
LKKSAAQSKRQPQSTARLPPVCYTCILLALHTTTCCRCPQTSPLSVEVWVAVGWYRLLGAPPPQILVGGLPGPGSPRRPTQRPAHHSGPLCLVSAHNLPTLESPPWPSTSAPDGCTRPKEISKHRRQRHKREHGRTTTPLPPRTVDSWAEKVSPKLSPREQFGGVERAVDER